MKKRPKRLTMPETIRVHEWMRNNADALSGLSAIDVAKLINTALNLPIAESSVRSIGKELKFKFKSLDTHKKASLKDILNDIVKEIGLPADHPLLEKISKY